MDNSKFVDCSYFLDPLMYWKMSAADLHAYFGIFLDYGSALPELVEHAATVYYTECSDSNFWALMLAAAYSKFPDLVSAEHTRVIEKYEECCARGVYKYDPSDGLRYGLFCYANCLLSSTFPAGNAVEG